MQLPILRTRVKNSGSIKDYIEVTKPKETSLLVFIGIVTAYIAAGSELLPVRLVFIIAVLLLASAGANGLTNYLDRNIDFVMERTRHRALPSGRIYPPERALVFTTLLTVGGLVLAWLINPVVFIIDLIGTLVAVTYRKKVTCVFPQGMIASCAPVLMGWFSVTYKLDWEILLLCVLIAVWLPSHIWSIMAARKNEYIAAGLTYFPIKSNPATISRLLFISCLLLSVSSITLYFVGHFGWLYLATAVASGIMIVYSSVRLMISNESRNAWSLFKISAFPYLGLIFLVMLLDSLLIK